MKTFSYTIKDEVGIHARPAGQLAKLAKEFSSTVTIEKDGKSVNATKLMMLMGLGVSAVIQSMYLSKAKMKKPPAPAFKNSWKRIFNFWILCKNEKTFRA